MLNKDKNMVEVNNADWVSMYNFDMFLMFIPSSKCRITLVALCGIPDHLFIALSVRVSIGWVSV